MTKKRFLTWTKHMGIIYVDTGKKPTREEIIKQMICQEPLISDEEAVLRHLIRKWGFRMTEKRFKLSEPNGAYLIDGDKPLFHMEGSDDEIVELLNNFNDENEQLKQQIKDLYKFVKYDVDNEIDVYPKSILEYLVNILKIIGDVE